LIDIRKRFLDNAAHQLRTPLTALKTQLALAQRNAEPAQAQNLLTAARQTTDDAVMAESVEEGEKMPTDKLVDVSPLALRMSSPFNAGYWLAAA
jgi:two-component system sensor histidine kinase TctE